MKKFLRTICLLIFVTTKAQYQDSLLEKVQNYPEFNTIRELSYRIQNDFYKKEDQAQAAFTWVANNIAYDLDYYYSIRSVKFIYHRTEDERLLELDKFEKELVRKTFKNKKGLCQGYAVLFKEICNYLEIPSVVVHGYTKLDTEIINSNPGFKNHSWNAVYFNQSWHLLDVTWAAGHEIGGKQKWVFNYNDIFFNQNPNQFIKHHFPQEKRWQLLNNTKTKKEFFSKPIYFSPYFNSQIVLSEKENGSITKSLKDKFIYIIFDELPSKKSEIQSMTRKSIRLERIRFKKNEDGTFTAKIKIKSDPDFLTIFYKNQAILNFKIITANY